MFDNLPLRAGRAIPSPSRSRNSTAAARTCSRISAVDRLRCQPALSRRAERARHPAAGLRRDADGVALRIAHQHRLECRPVDRAPQHLSRLARVALDLADGVEQLREHRLGDLLSHRRGQVGHLARVGDQPAVVLVGQLLRAKRGQPEFRRRPRRGRPRRGRRSDAAASRVAVGRRPGAGMGTWAVVSIPSWVGGN